MFQKKKDLYGWLLLMVILAMGAGAAAGFVSSQYSRSNLPNQEVDLNSFNNPNLIISDAKKVVVNQDLKVLETYNAAQASFVGIFKRLPDNSKSKKLAYYDLDQSLATGFILSSDGWLVLNASQTDLEKLDLSEANLPAFVAVTYDKKEYKLDQLIYEKAEPWIFVHLQAASNLPVRKLLDTRSLQMGQSLLLISPKGAVMPTFLVDKVWPNLVRSSDQSAERLVLADALSNDFKKAFVFNLGGDLVALSDDNKELILAGNLDLGWQRLMKDKASRAPYLGLYYLDLDRIKLSANSINYGALVYPNEKGLIFDPESPAAKSGLKSGDIILRLEGQELRGGFGLSEALAEHKAGDVITLSYRRDGQDQDVDIKLGERK
ncbi:MAG: S1C family serine protease [Patescibacteria group bacterium]